jgi:hypothetical protein
MPLKRCTVPYLLCYLLIAEKEPSEVCLLCFRKWAWTPVRNVPVMSLTSLLLARYLCVPVARTMAGGRKRPAASDSSKPAAKKKAAVTANGSLPAAKKNKTETDWDGLDFKSDSKGKNGDS